MRTNEIATFITGVLILAGLAVALSKDSQTAKVLESGGSSFAGIIKAAAYGK